MDRVTICSDALRRDDLEVLGVNVRKEGGQRVSNILTEEGKRVLDEENFGSCDFWEGYKLYCYARYSHCNKSKARFLASKMGRVVNLIYKDNNVRWGSLFDQSVRQVLAMMEEYADVFQGRDWKNLRALMEEFDDVKRLFASEKGRLLLQVVEDDESGTEGLHRQSLALKVQTTDLFDDIQVRLKRAGSNLSSLMKTSEHHQQVTKTRRLRLTVEDVGRPQLSTKRTIVD